MDIRVPWEVFLALIELVYHKPSRMGSRPQIPLVVMLRIHLLQQWFKLSDPLMEDMLADTPCFRRFAGIETMEGSIPDETTILNFRHQLEKHRIAEQILEGINQMIIEKEVMLKEGTILDATIIASPAPPRTSPRRGIRKCTKWPRGTSVSLGCAATSGWMLPLAWCTPS